MAQYPDIAAPKPMFDSVYIVEVVCRQGLQLNNPSKSPVHNGQSQHNILQYRQEHRNKMAEQELLMQNRLPR